MAIYEVEFRINKVREYIYSCEVDLTPEEAEDFFENSYEEGSGSREIIDNLRNRDDIYIEEIGDNIEVVDDDYSLLEVTEV